MESSRQIVGNHNSKFKILVFRVRLDSHSPYRENTHTLPSIQKLGSLSRALPFTFFSFLGSYEIFQTWQTHKMHNPSGADSLHMVVGIA